MTKVNDTDLITNLGVSNEYARRLQSAVPIPVNCLIEGLITLKIGFAIHDRDLRYVALNQVLADFDGLSIQAHIGRTTREVLGKLSTQVEIPLRKVFKTGKPQLNIEIIGQRPGRPDSGRWIDNFFPLTGLHSNVTHVGVMVVEIKNHSQIKTICDKVAHQTESVRGLRADPQKSPEIKAEAQIPTTLNSNRSSFSSLSSREKQILGLLAEGKSNKEIAWQLGISVKTVESHRSRLMIKLNAPSLAYLVHYAIGHHIVQVQI
jgi:DNA-binding CsgD family transcriptional regulator